MARGLSQEMRREKRRAQRQRQKARRRERAQHSQSLQQQSNKLSEETKVKAEEIGQEQDMTENQQPKLEEVDNEQTGKMKQEPQSQPAEPAKAKTVPMSADDWHPSKLPSDLRHLHFGSATSNSRSFSVKDHHLDLVAAGGKDFCHKLEAFSCDKHVQGHDLTDAAITRLAMACPNLQTAKLTSTTKLTDESVLAFLTHCPGLRTLSIIGNYPTKGNITGKLAFADLKQNKALGRNLHTLKLVDQRVGQDDVMRLSRARKNLVVWEGYVVGHAGEVVLDDRDLLESESEDEYQGEYEYGDGLTYWDIQDALPEWERWHHW
ncbi:hypothetical protein G647_03596 [Cladophialophora carrionii CBS 160.54]|uniref:Uncharacterized protein n=1 Tax=Cladophialophora carrionii CBS 160.54 TaxID=1279043 RepID=V9DE44_9EURO|nr:uncharacterized protein G647_03596 [Cladophialophora carrionii CBS 160.54]ETI24227.1 hypothetical protein G647_03596 [Cladophialophora carrionii CBS 160.54]